MPDTSADVSPGAASPCPPPAPGPAATPDPASPHPVLVALESFVDPLDFTTLFGRPGPVEVDLGSGDGGFLLRYAPRHLDTGFIGVERLLGRIRKIGRKAPRLGITNLRGVRLEAAYFAQYLCPPASIRAFHVYFPDPWPKRRHRKRRLVTPAFATALHQALAPDGHVHLRTDDADYHAQMVEVFSAATGFSPIETPPALAAVLTDFEETFLAQGRTTRRASYSKSA